MIQEYLVWSDLQALDSSPSAVREKFDSLYSKNPDGIALNDTTYFNAVQPAITQQYGHYCYKQLSEITYTEAGQSSNDAVVGSNTAYNNSDAEAEIALTVSGGWTETTEWSSSVTAGMTFSAEIGLEGVFKMGMSFNVSTTIGQSKSSSVNKGASSTVTVKVPAHSAITVELVATMKKETMDFSAPIQVSGMFGANFPDRVEGHYFWFADAGSVLPKTSGTLTGQITGTAAFNVQTKINPARALA